MNLIKFKETLRDGLHAALGDELYERIQFRRRVGYWPRLRNPRSFNEHVANAKVLSPHPEAHILADKAAVREYVRRTIGEKYLTKVYFIGQPRDIPWHKLPGSFVMKCTHGTGNVTVLNNKAECDFDAIQKKYEALLAETFGFWTNEHWYRKIPPQVIVEELLMPSSSENSVPPDIRLFCMNGKVRLISVDEGRFKTLKIRFYTPTWVPYEFQVNNRPLAPVTLPPAQLSELIALAESLAKGIRTVRVDMYVTKNNRICFGEMTFANVAGWVRFQPQHMDFELGALWST